MASNPDALLDGIVAELLVPLDRSLLGPAKAIYCYRPRGGGCPAREFLQDLPKEARASYAKQFERACQGHFLRGDKWHGWTGRGNEGLFEYKDIQSKSRLVHTMERGNLHILLFGFTGKKEDQIDELHVNRARRLRDEYLERRTEIERRLKRKR